MTDQSGKPRAEGTAEEAQDLTQGEATPPERDGSPAEATTTGVFEEPERLTTALVYDEAFLAHKVPAGFPEVPERLRESMRVIEATLATGALPEGRVLRLPAREATRDELAAAHTPAHIERIHDRIAALGAESRPAEIAPEVYAAPESWRAAVLAAGAPLAVLDAVGEGRARNGYALVRPPGHHAGPDYSMGFCIFNNVAVAARYAQQKWGWRRVLIVDYDVHHGNGTQDIFYEDGDVLYFSTHQSPFYPGTGASTERGAGAGEGATVNVPLPAGSGWSVYDPIFRQVLWPLADRFKPDVVLLSAGYDAHWADPLAEMRLSTADYSDLTLEVAEIADTYAQGRLVAVQEGGYHLDAVAQCAATILLALAGSDQIVDALGEPPVQEFRWNEEAILRALYDLHDLAGYRRKPRRPGVRTAR
ncbi:MAG TPA: histone deacetylase [Ktedonobacterales bacterium]|nr:histone deacetylase [Ktedonobacterales bacterium]